MTFFKIGAFIIISGGWEDDCILGFNLTSKYIYKFYLLLLIETLHKEQIKYHRLILASFIGGGMVFSYLLWYQLF